MLASLPCTSDKLITISRLMPSSTPAFLCLLACLTSLSAFDFVTCPLRASGLPVALLDLRYLLLALPSPRIRCLSLTSLLCQVREKSVNVAGANFPSSFGLLHESLCFRFCHVSSPCFGVARRIARPPLSAARSSLSTHSLLAYWNSLTTLQCQVREKSVSVAGVNANASNESVFFWSRPSATEPLSARETSWRPALPSAR